MCQFCMAISECPIIKIYTYMTPGRKGATQDKWTLRFWSSTHKSRGRQEGHQMVATKEDPRAIPARG